MSRLTELEKLFSRYNESYYNGEAEITDEEFDAIRDELTKLSPDNPLLKKVGAVPEGEFPPARHIMPMGSQEKAKNETEFREWADKKILERFAEWTRDVYFEIDALYRMEELICKSKDDYKKEFDDWLKKLDIEENAQKEKDEKRIVRFIYKDNKIMCGEKVLWKEGDAPSLSCFLVQHKLDGISLELQYENGVLLKAVDRGDGVTGSDLTANARKIGGVLPQIDKSFSGAVRGEVILLLSVWKEKFQDGANWRNAANGIMHRKDGEGNQHLVFKAYDALKENGKNFSTEKEKMAWLTSNKFNTAWQAECNSIDEVIKIYNAQFEKRASLSLDFWIDGLVIKDNITDIKDLEKARPDKQIAFKFPSEEKTTVLRSVEWSESGFRYTPIALFDPVQFADAKVKRATLHNPDYIRALDLKIGSKIVVIKSGEIIPKVLRLAEDNSIFCEEIELPTNCASCGAELKNTGTQLYCPNSECEKKLFHRIEKWVAVLDIMELGDKILNQLFYNGGVKKIADFYTLNIKTLAAFERMGEKSAAKIISNLEKKKNISLVEFIAGFNFEGIGKKIVDKISAAGFDTLEKLRSANEEELANIDGIGSETARTLKAGLEEAAADIDAVLKYVSIIKPEIKTGKLSGASFCFTGQLLTMKRAEAEERVRGSGGEVKSDVAKGLTYLVTNDPDSGSSKNTKAKKFGTTLLTEKEFCALLESDD